MTEELLKRINNDNYRIINELADIIINNKINNIDELKAYQDSLFTIKGNKLSHSEQINYCKKIIDSNPYIKEDIDFLDLQRIQKLKEELKNNSSKNVDKRIIELMSLLEKSMLLPFDAYNMIMND